LPTQSFAALHSGLQTVARFTGPGLATPYTESEAALRAMAARNLLLKQWLRIALYFCLLPFAFCLSLKAGLVASDAERIGDAIDVIEPGSNQGDL
jgi:hypothetical protein